MGRMKWRVRVANYCDTGRVERAVGASKSERNARKVLFGD
jgi:hypothetical protein